MRGAIESTRRVVETGRGVTRTGPGSGSCRRLTRTGGGSGAQAPNYIGIVLLAETIARRRAGYAFGLVILGNRLPGADYHDWSLDGFNLARTAGAGTSI